MQIKIPRVVVPVPMSGYSEELGELCLMVWVNPPQEFFDEHKRLTTELQAIELERAKQSLKTDPAPAPETWLKPFEQALHWVRSKPKENGTDPALLMLYLELWNQGADPATHWTLDELRKLESEDPTFLSWMITQTWKARAAHVEQKKKF